MGRLGAMLQRLRGVGGTAGRMRAGVGKGLRFDAGPSNPDYATGRNELPVQQCLAARLRSGAVFYDVGANVGFISVIAAKLVGPRGRVYAFEPVPANAEWVRRNAAANGFDNVLVVEAAVAARSGRADLALAAYSGGAALAASATPPDCTGLLDVEVVSIDELVERRGFGVPDLVKVDVEGGELEVLEGMERTVQRHRPAVLFEIDDAELEGMHEKQRRCEEWLRARGYNVRQLPPSYPGLRWHVGHWLATPADAG